jgi:hypothetical protein
MIRIFVGCSANGEDVEAQAMLEYSVRRHHRGEVLEIVWMMLSRDPASIWYANPARNEGWIMRGWATPFSAFRWAVPYACNFQGKAIYLDVDMIAMADIGELWQQPIPAGACMLTKDEKHSCVILFDCARARSALPSFDALRRTEGLYRNVRRNIGASAARFAGNWNCLDGEKYASLADPDVKLIHFTKVETQPHLKWALPRLRAQGLRHWNGLAVEQPHARADVRPLVDQLWIEAQAAGYRAESYLPRQPFGAYDMVRGGARAA